MNNPQWYYGVKHGTQDNDIYEVDPPPGEVHPDKLRRCEVCRHRDNPDDDDDHGLVCLALPMGRTPWGTDRYVDIPPSHTCEHWEYDGHNTEGEG